METGKNIRTLKQTKVFWNIVSQLYSLYLPKKKEENNTPEMNNIFSNTAYKSIIIHANKKKEKIQIIFENLDINFGCFLPNIDVGSNTRTKFTRGR